MSQVRTNALRERIDRLRAQNRAMTEVSQLERNADTAAIEVRGVLSEARKTSGLTMQQMAERLHVSAQTVSAIENSDGNLGVKTMLRYLGALDIDLMLLVTDIRQSTVNNLPTAEDAASADGTSGASGVSQAAPSRNLNKKMGR